MRSVKVTFSVFRSTLLVFLALFIQQHHDAVSVGVAIKLPCNNMAVLPEDGHQPLIVAPSDGGGVPDEGQVSHRDVGDDVHLQYKNVKLQGLNWLSTPAVRSEFKPFLCSEQISPEFSPATQTARLGRSCWWWLYQVRSTGWCWGSAGAGLVLPAGSRNHLQERIRSQNNQQKKTNL